MKLLIVTLFAALCFAHRHNSVYRRLTLVLHLQMDCFWLFYSTLYNCPDHHCDPQLTRLTRIYHNCRCLYCTFVIVLDLQVFIVYLLIALCVTKLLDAVQLSKCRKWDRPKQIQLHKWAQLDVSNQIWFRETMVDLTCQNECVLD